MGFKTCKECNRQYDPNRFTKCPTCLTERYRKELSHKDKTDMVNHPPHYTQGKFEVIDILQDKLTHEEFKGYLQGNILKYMLRYKHKNGVEDLKKAQWYQAKLIEVLENEKNKIS